MILLLFLILSQLFAPQLGGTHFLPCLLRVDSRAQQRPGAMPCLGLGTRGKEKETQAHFAEDVLSRQTGSCSFWWWRKKNDQGFHFWGGGSLKGQPPSLHSAHLPWGPSLLTYFSGFKRPWWVLEGKYRENAFFLFKVCSAFGLWGNFQNETS